MKKYILIVALAALVVLVDGQLASAGRRGGRRGGGGGGCGGGGCGYYGGCGGGGCGYYGGGYGGYIGCSTCGGGGYMMAGGTGAMASGGYVCANGMCTSVPYGSGTALTQGNEAQATLVVNLPADATLTIDDEATSSISANRVFITPPLESGREFHYTLKAQVIRDGKVQTTTQQVAVRAGEVSRVELTIPATTGAAQ